MSGLRRGAMVRLTKPLKVTSGTLIHGLLHVEMGASTALWVAPEDVEPVAEERALVPGERPGYYFPTLKGRRFYPEDPQPGDFDLEEIAHAASFLCRFGGHIRDFYSVAEHCVRVARVVYAVTGNHQLALYGLMHDAAEAYIGDVTWPVKNSRYMRDYKKLERLVEDALNRQFGLPLAMPDVVKHCDLVLLATEKRDLRHRDDSHVRHEHDLAKSSYGLHEDIAPLDETIVPWDMQTAEYTFLDEFRIWSHGP